MSWISVAVSAGADHPITGDVLRLRDPVGPGGRLSFRTAGDAVLAPGTNDPSQHGATLNIVGEGSGDGSSGQISLPASRWRGLGHPAGSRGFKYLDPSGASGVRRVVFATGILTVAGHGRAWPYAITQPQSAIRVRFQVADEAYCARFTALLVNRVRRVVARDAPRPVGCSAVCGNGVLEVGEGCDDANAIDGDGCSGNCRLESVAGLCAGASTVSGTSLATTLVTAAVTKPTHIASAPLDTDRLFIVEQIGHIRLVQNDVLLNSDFLDIHDRISCCDERGLLSVAFHPEFATNGWLFVDYTDASGDTVIARYEGDNTTNSVDPSTEKILLHFTQPFANHNGGQLAFGPDGYLYVGMGDGGSQGDPNGFAQSSSSPLGKLLRIDVNVAGTPYYAIPSGNPYSTAGDPLDKVWARGFRNPWRFSFDRGPGDLYIGDVGGDNWEEIDVQPAASTGGENYGWNLFEGSHCLAGGCPDPSGFVMPLTEYPHGDDCSVTGGFVYRGCRLPDLRGTYFYTDYCSNRVRTLRYAGGTITEQGDKTTELRPTGGPFTNLTSFGEDARGELYLADYDGRVFKIVPQSDVSGTRP